jgi:amino acid permease
LGCEQKTFENFWYSAEKLLFIDWFIIIIIIISCKHMREKMEEEEKERQEN